MAPAGTGLSGFAGNVVGFGGVVLGGDVKFAPLKLLWKESGRGSAQRLRATVCLSGLT